MSKRLVVNVFIALAMSVVLCNCKKDNSQEDINTNYYIGIIAGDSLKNEFTKLDYTLVNHSVSDSIPSVNKYSSGKIEDLPMYINKDDTADIRYGRAISYMYEYMVSQSYYFSNCDRNDNKIEFAITNKKELGIKDSVYILKLYNEFDSINANQTWKASKTTEKYYLSLLNRFQPYFKDMYKGSNVSINTNVTNKYIGLRRKVNQGYIYGWLKVSITNNEKLIVSGCAFSHR